jgi:hypothetical protein
MSLDSRLAATPPSASPPGGAAAAGAAPSTGGSQMLVGSYPAPVAASPPPTMHTITTADAMATEGRIIEDAAMHEQYVRVITPEPQPTEEMEEVRWEGGWSLVAGGRLLEAWLLEPLLQLAAAGRGSYLSAAACSPRQMHCCLTPCHLPLPPPLFSAASQVCYLLQQSLDMRARWLFRPQYSPEQLAHLPEEATVTRVLGDPFHWQPQVRGAELWAAVWLGCRSGGWWMLLLLWRMPHRGLQLPGLPAC